LALLAKVEVSLPSLLVGTVLLLATAAVVQSFEPDATAVSGDVGVMFAILW
jgi:hypothetical protein